MLLEPRNALFIPIGLYLATSILSFAPSRRLGYYRALLGLIVAASLSFLTVAPLLYTLYPGKEIVVLKGLPVPQSSLVVSVDALSLIFLTLINFVTLVSAIHSIKYIEVLAREGADLRLYTASTSLFALSMSLTVVVRDVLWFFILWEVMTITSLSLIAYSYRESMVRFSTYLYAALMHVGALCMLIGLFVPLAYAHAHSWSFSSFYSSLRSLTPALAYASLALMSIGFLSKMGIAPLHLWLPDAHASAPTPISAMLSGVMVKVGVYGLIRFCILGAAAVYASQLYGFVLLALAAVTVFIGAGYAAYERDFKRVLAFSTVENMGIILAGLAVASIGIAVGSRVLEALGLVAALAHCINHSVFKSLSFLSMGTVLRAVGTRCLDEVGGLGKALPTTSKAAFIGLASAAALPPFSGFVSKYLVYQTLLAAAFVLSPWFERFASAIATLALLASSVFTSMALAKVYGLTFLGKPRRRDIEPEALSERVALIVATIACVGSAMVFPYIVEGIERGLGLPALVTVWSYIFLKIESPWSSAPLSMLYIALGVLTALGFAIAAQRSREVKYLHPFVSGVEYDVERHRPRTSAMDGYVAGYLARLLGVERRIERRYSVQYWTTEVLEYRRVVKRPLLDPSPRIGEAFERVLYAPLKAVVLGIGRGLRELQCGRLSLYIVYIFIAFVLTAIFLAVVRP